MIEKFMGELFDSVEWGQLDYLVVDLPPGTANATFSLLQNVAVTGSIIVTTPHQMSVTDARKGLQMFRSHDTPVLEIVENMSQFACPDCGETHELFGSGGGETTVEKHGVGHLATIPFDRELNADPGSNELPVRSADTAAGEEFRRLAPTVANLIGEVNRRARSRGEERCPSPTSDSCG